MSSPAEAESERRSREILLGTDPQLRRGHRLMRHIPSDPRCKLCASPFGGPLGRLMGVAGKSPWPKNPKYCSACFKQLAQHRLGAEIECSLLFADVRGSTSLAEQMRPTDFRALMNRFFEASSRILVKHDAIVDKFVGDEVIAIFIPALAGERHAARAIAAGRELLATTASNGGPTRLAVGVGVNSGVAFVGAVGEGEQVELTAMGDAVNVAARLASAAAAAELLVSLDSATSAGLDEPGAERRKLELKGKSEPTEVLVLGPAGDGHASAKR